MRSVRLHKTATVAIALFAAAPLIADPLGSAFTYQGRLTNAGSPANGLHTMQFRLFPVPAGGTQVGPTLTHDGNSLPQVGVASGLFTVQLDFGAASYNGDKRWLDITVAGTPLSPRQELTPAPHARFSAAPWATSGADISYTGGNVGIGTASPANKLHVLGDTQLDGLLNLRRNDPNALITFFPQGGSGGRDWWVGSTRSSSGVASSGSFFIWDQSATSVRMVINSSGELGIGTNSPDPQGKNSRLTIDSGNLNPSRGIELIHSGSGFGAGMVMRNLGADAGPSEWSIYADTLGNLVFGDENTSHAVMTLEEDTNHVIVDVLEINGGADLAESYDIASSQGTTPKPGMVVVIDPSRVGKLQVADQAYDRRVAGVISGADGVRPGLILNQKGSVAEGEHPVANVGRVWCLCDAEAGGAIQAGDLLTSSVTPGHAMKATEFSRSQGAVLGKAMSSLEHGRGLVLVLVSLQ